jgi:hypothetical protein
MNLTPFFVALHADDTARQRQHRDWEQSAITPENVDEIWRRLQCQHAFGSARFQQMIEEQLQRRARKDRQASEVSTSRACGRALTRAFLVFRFVDLGL